MTIRVISHSPRRVGWPWHTWCWTARTPVSPLEPTHCPWDAPWYPPRPLRSSSRPWQDPFPWRYSRIPSRGSSCAWDGCCVRCPAPRHSHPSGTYNPMTCTSERPPNDVVCRPITTSRNHTMTSNGAAATNDICTSTRIPRPRTMPPSSWKNMNFERQPPTLLLPIRE